MHQRSNIKFPNTITVNRLTACCEEVTQGNDGNAIMPGTFEFSSFLFGNAANIRVMIFQSFNELGVFIIDGFSRFDRADILVP